MFRILVVDDDPSVGHLLRHAINVRKAPLELSLAFDGAEALDFLHRRGSYSAAPGPDLILLDMNMPGLSGLDTLISIKADLQLKVIPVVVFSSTGTPDVVYQSYQSLANCYVIKPTSLAQTQRLIEALESFWVEFAVLPEMAASNVRLSTPVSPLLAADAGYGQVFAQRTSEVSQVRADGSAIEKMAPCEEHKRLLESFGEAVREVLELHKQQFRAIVDGDPDSNRFDLLIHMANEKKQDAKYAYIRHTEGHGC